MALRTSYSLTCDSPADLPATASPGERAYCISNDTVYIRSAGAWRGYNLEALPVGSVFISVAATGPATLLGYGTWAAFGQGRCLVGLDPTDSAFDTIEETGGAKIHTLTVAEMPAHSHTQDPHTHTYASQTATSGAVSSYEHGAIDTSSTAAESSISTNPATATNQNTGGGGAHNNLQPYVVVYFWKRIA